MDELDSPRVKRLPSEHDVVATLPGAAQLLARNPGPAAVELVAQHRTADMREMNTNLVCRSAGRAKLPEVKRQGTCQRSRPVAAGWMNHHPRRLVDRDNVLVLIQNVERDLLGVRTRSIHRRQDHFDPVAGPQSMRDLRPLPVDFDAAGPNHFAKL